jgi:hypothetical protein
MSAVSNRIFGVAIASVVAASVFVAPAANASGLPNLSLSLSSNTGTTAFDPAAYGNAWANPNQTFSYTGQHSQSGQWNLGWSMLLGPEKEEMFIVANFVVTNNSLVTQTFNLSLTNIFAVNFPGLMDVSMGGSVTGSLTDLNGNGATLGSPVNGSLYTAFIDGNAVATLLDDPFSVSAGVFESAVVGPASFGDPIPSDPAPNALTSIGIDLEFTLSAGDAASFTSIFVISGMLIPGPGAIAFFALAGFAGRRRRMA